MLSKRENSQVKMHYITIEDLVPSDHFLRKLDVAVDFSFIYDEVRDLYCENNGRPSIDPVVLVKYLLIGYLFGIESERQIEHEIQVNMAYRWFLGLDLDDSVPDHSTISQNRKRRFNGQNLYRRLFERILEDCIAKGLVGGKLVLTDSTHVKANASRDSEYKVWVAKEATSYTERLDRYEALERERLEGLGKIQAQEKRPNRKKTPSKVEKTVSATDPDAGLLVRPEKPRGMHYLDHQSIDAKNGIIVDVAVTSGNTHDSTPYLDRMEYIRDEIGLKFEKAGDDSAYDSSIIHKEMSDNGTQLLLPPSNRKPNEKTEFKRNDFTYDQTEDVFVCPFGMKLPLRQLQRSDSGIYREYRASRQDCNFCPYRSQCLSASMAERSRRIVVNIFEDAARENRARVGTDEYKEAMNLRRIWCEGTFALQKARHNLREMFRRGIEAAEDHCLLSATAVNMKRMVRCLG